MSDPHNIAPSDAPPPEPVGIRPPAPHASLKTVLLLLVSAALLFTGFTFGRLSRAPAATQSVAPAPAAITQIRDSRAAMASRNKVWSGLNDVDNLKPDSAESMTAMIVAAMLEADGSGRALGFRMFTGKSAACFPDEEGAQMEQTLNTGTTEEVRATVARIAEADARCAELLGEILADKVRITQYVEKRGPLALERMPDGSTP